MTKTDKQSVGERLSSNQAPITTRQIAAAIRTSVRIDEDVWLSDPAPRGAGRLQIRCTHVGAVLLYFRYTHNGSRVPFAIGVYDPDGAAGFTLAQARARAGELSRLYQSGIRDLRAHLAAQQDHQAAQRAAELQERAHSSAGSLQALCLAYGDSLTGRPSERDVRALLRLHVIDAHPN